MEQAVDRSAAVEVPKISWIDRLERGIIVASRAFAMIVWGVVGAPVWALLICFGLLFVILVTIARAVTGRQFAIDRKLLTTVIRFYPNGLRSLKSEFAKIDQELEEADEQPSVESSYLFSTFQAIGVLSIGLLFYAIYANIDFSQVPPSAYYATVLIVVVALTMATGADRRKRHIAAPRAAPQGSAPEKVTPAN